MNKVVCGALVFVMGCYGWKPIQPSTLPEVSRTRNVRQVQVIELETGETHTIRNPQVVNLPDDERLGLVSVRGNISSARMRSEEETLRCQREHPYANGYCFQPTRTHRPGISFDPQTTNVRVLSGRVGATIGLVVVLAILASTAFAVAYTLGR